MYRFPRLMLEAFVSITPAPRGGKIMPKSAEKPNDPSVTISASFAKRKSSMHSPANSIDHLLDVVNKPQQIFHGASITMGRNSGRIVGLIKKFLSFMLCRVSERVPEFDKAE